MSVETFVETTPVVSGMPVGPLTQAEVVAADFAATEVIDYGYRLVLTSSDGPDPAKLELVPDYPGLVIEGEDYGHFGSDETRRARLHDSNSAGNGTSAPPSILFRPQIRPEGIDPFTLVLETHTPRIVRLGSGSGTSRSLIGPFTIAAPANVFQPEGLRTLDQLSHLQSLAAMGLRSEFVGSLERIAGPALDARITSESQDDNVEDLGVPSGVVESSPVEGIGQTAEQVDVPESVIIESQVNERGGGESRRERLGKASLAEHILGGFVSAKYRHSTRDPNPTGTLAEHILGDLHPKRLASKASQLVVSAKDKITQFPAKAVDADIQSPANVVGKLGSAKNAVIRAFIGAREKAIEVFYDNVINVSTTKRIGQLVVGSLGLGLAYELNEGAQTALAGDHMPTPNYDQLHGHGKPILQSAVETPKGYIPRRYTPDSALIKHSVMGPAKMWFEGSLRADVAIAGLVLLGIGASIPHMRRSSLQNRSNRDWSLDSLIK